MGECDYTFSEQMELRSFPFDCQDFTIVIRESSGTKKAVLLPEPRYASSKHLKRSEFFKLDPTFSMMDEWDFYSTMLEVADSSSGASRSKSVYHEITVRFKMKRRWKVYIYNIIIYFMVITFLSLTCFALDYEDIGERLNLAVMIVLTLVAFQHTIFSKLPNIPYLTFMDKYILLSFLFVSTVLLESSFIPIVSYWDLEELEDEEIEQEFKDVAHEHIGFAFDVTMSWLFGLFWIGYHLFFIFRSGWIHHQQTQKLLMDSDQIAELVEEKYPQYLFSWKSLRDFIKSGNYEEWAQQESILEVQRRESVLEEAKKNKYKKKKRLRQKKAHCVMEFGGLNGEILTFASYAQKDVHDDLTFCGYIRQMLGNCGIACLGCICCECCRGQKDTNDEIKRRKSQAYDQAKSTN